MDAFLYQMVKASKHYIYATAYRGWFPNLNNHHYNWNEGDGCFYNDISPHRVEELLENIGCYDIKITPLKTGNEAIPYETLITAVVGSY